MCTFSAKGISGIKLFMENRKGKGNGKGKQRGRGKGISLMSFCGNKLDLIIWIQVESKDSCNHLNHSTVPQSP